MIPEASRPSPPPSTPTQQRALGVLAVASVAALAILSLPVASGLFLGTVLAFSLLPVYQRLARKPERRGIAAVGLTLGSGLVVVAGLATLGYFVIARGMAAASTLAAELSPGRPFRATLERTATATRSSMFRSIDVAERLRETASTAASKLTTWAAAIAGTTVSAMLVLLFTLLATFFVLRHWPELATRLERMLPLNPLHTRLLLAEFQKVGKEVFVGTMLTGLVQGIVAGIGFAVVGVPEAALLGALTAACSLVPAVGTLLVWVPVGVVLIAVGRPVAGVFELAWGALVVGVVCDYVVRPRLVGGKGHLPTLVTFVALFGGVEVFGLLGLIIGPVVASVALAMLRTYDAEICARALRASSGL